MEIWAEQQRHFRGAIPEMAVENGTILAFEAWQHVWSSVGLALHQRQRSRWVKVSKEMWTRMGILWKKNLRNLWWTGSSQKAEPCQFLQLSFIMLRCSKCTRNIEWVKEEGKKGVGREGGKYSSLCYQEGDGYSLRQNPGWILRMSISTEFLESHPVSGPSTDLPYMWP